MTRPRRSAAKKARTPEQKKEENILDYWLNEFEKKWPKFTIGAIDIWGEDGRIEYWRDGNIKQWRASRLESKERHDNG